ncbi:hypothetical protein LAZ67_21001303 [Cordylochernes scorpioides]|uniref:Gag-Pol-p199 n=1 Tax=Cordylochernes scorpioides TaxID=51811 RepID=A0ABY6LM32_9ARAC|nr:hypothetical protein LAZ67_21001303 [Cordylochernes scorpioides]
MKELMKICKIKHCFTTSYHPQSNSLTERLNRTLIDMISIKPGKCEKLLRKYFGPYIILKKLSDLNYSVVPKDNLRHRTEPTTVHISRIKPYFERTDDCHSDDKYVHNIRFNKFRQNSIRLPWFQAMALINAGAFFDFITSFKGRSYSWPTAPYVIENEDTEALLPDSNGEKRSWCIDSGCTTHLSPHLDWMEDVVPYESEIDLAEKDKITHSTAKGLRIDNSRKPENAMATSDTSNDKISIWHRRLNHLNQAYMKEMIQGNLVKEWEMSLLEKEYPSYEKMISFLERFAGSLGSFQNKENSKQFYKMNKSTHSHSATFASGSSIDSRVKSCVLCKGEYFLLKCPKFNGMMLPERWTFVKDNRLCYNCLRSNHRVSSCVFTQNCKSCNKRHHTLLHQFKPEMLSPVADISPLTHASVSCFADNKSHDRILLSTALIKVKSENGVLQTCRALIDTGSQRCLITNSCRKKLNLPLAECKTTVFGLGNKLVEQSMGESLITSELPDFFIEKDNWPYLKNLLLADPNFDKSSQIDLVIGAELAPCLFNGKVRFQNVSGPTACGSKLGWLLTENFMEKKPSEPLLDYRLLTVTYGLSCAPYLAMRTLHQLAREKVSTFPVASKIVQTDFYVDDLLSGADTIEEATCHIREVNNLLSSAGFSLRKWRSNVPEVLSGLSEQVEDRHNLWDFESDSCVKILGICWNPSLDIFQILVNDIPEQTNSKRHLLSHISRIFDPIGWLSPVIIRLKILLQSLWKQKLNWDDPLPDTLCSQWKKIEKELSVLNKIQIPRYFSCRGALLSVELHGFCDSSEVAYAEVFYIRSNFKSGQVKVSLIASKTRVAPLKMISIPRLELLRSRGITPSELVDHSLWWRGPTWLSDVNFEDPIQTQYDFPKEISERTSIFTSELTSSIHNIIRFIQSSEFQSEITCCKQKKSLPTNSRLLSLNPFIDESGLLRVGGRLRHSNLQFDEKHPIILPRDHFITELIVRQCHLDHLHSGLQLTMSALRLRYWIPAGRSLVKKIIHQCMVCFRAKRQVTKQIMGDLPMHRIVKSNPFTKTGIDFAGPFLMKPNIKISKVKLKSYVALFVCFCTKAIHIEIVSDLSSAAFLAALKRFISRRGKPSDIFSDNGTNFRGANNILREQFDILKSSTIQKLISNERINWHFIPPSAPNFGGIWEAGIKSFKFHLLRCLKSQILTYEELSTLTTQIEACLNSRPICPLSLDSDDFNPLTPGHFLIGRPLTALPESNDDDVPINYLDRWSLNQKIKNEGDLILLKDTISPPAMYWSLGRITKVFPRADGKVRVVEKKHQRKRANSVCDILGPLGPVLTDARRTSMSTLPCSRGGRRHSWAKGNNTTEPLELIHMDLCGPMTNKCLGGSRYFFVLVDDFSRRTFVYFLKTKDETFDRFRDFKARVENELNLKIKDVRTDNRTEFINDRFKGFLIKNGIHHQLTTTYSPQSNGVAERITRTLVETARTLLIDSRLPMPFWAEAVATAAYVKNCTSHKSLRHATPMEKWKGKKPSIRHFRIFGCLVYWPTNKRRRNKFSPKSQKGVFIGYSLSRKAHRVYNIFTGKIEEVRSVKFKENKKGIHYSNNLRKDTNYGELSYRNENKENISEIIPLKEYEKLINKVTTRRTYRRRKCKTRSQERRYSKVLEERHREKIREYKIKLQEQGVRRSQRIKEMNKANIVLEEEEYVPENYEEAMKCQNRNEWIVAMKKELESINEHEVWTLVPREENMKIINSKWIYSMKGKSGMGDPKRKARLVVIGGNPKYGIDYEESFSTVIRKESLRIIVALAAQLKLTIKSYDVKTAYLNGELKETIFMKQPEGFVKKDEEDKVCKRSKIIYGLPQSGRCWNKRINEILSELGMIRYRYDPCVYTLQKGREFGILGLYVDDLLIAGTDQAFNDNLALEIGNFVDLKEKEENEPFIGIEIRRTEHGYDLSQTHYINKILRRFGLEECNIVQTPGDRDQNFDEYKDSKPVDKTLYQEMIGSLMYLATGTRPDISYNGHGCYDLHFQRLTPGFHRRVKAKTHFQYDDAPRDDITTKPLFTPQEKGRKSIRDRVPRLRLRESLAEAPKMNERLYDLLPYPTYGPLPSPGAIFAHGKGAPNDAHTERRPKSFKTRVPRLRQPRKDGQLTASLDVRENDAPKTSAYPLTQIANARSRLTTPITAENTARHGNRAAEWRKPGDKFPTLRPDIETMLKATSRNQLYKSYKSYMEHLPRQQEYKPRPSLLTEQSTNMPRHSRRLLGRNTAASRRYRNARAIETPLQSETLRALRRLRYSEARVAATQTMQVPVQRIQLWTHKPFSGLQYNAHIDYKADSSVDIGQMSRDGEFSSTSLHLGRPLKVLTEYRQSWSRQSGKLGNVHTKNEDTVALRKFREQIKVELGAKDGDRNVLTDYMVDAVDLGYNRRELALRVN